MPLRTNAEQFLVSGPSTLLTPLLGLLTEHPAMEVLRVSRSNRGDLRRLVVAMDSTRASALRIALGDVVQVEENVEVRPI